MSFPTDTREQGVPAEDPDRVGPIAQAIIKAGMAGPAVLALNIARPVAWVGGQMLWMLEPFLHSFGPARQNTLTTSALARLLEREEEVDDLITLLETPKQRP